MTRPDAVPPAESLIAYPSPWRLDRSLPPPWYRLEHRGFEAAHGITVTLLGSARLLAAVPGRMVAGDSIRIAVRGADPADDSILVVKWRRPDGTTYLWRASF